MACGKSTLGRALAATIAGYTFVDLDDAIEESAGMSVAEIFAHHSEDGFRQIENKVLCQTSRMHNVIVACGGGTPCFGDNMAKMLATGTVVWLQANTDITISRLRLAPGKRPLVDKVLNDDTALRNLIEDLQSRRRDDYSRASATFDSSELDTLEQIEHTTRRFINTFINP